MALASKQNYSSLQQDEAAADSTEDLAVGVPREYKSAGCRPRPVITTVLVLVATVLGFALGFLTSASRDTCEDFILRWTPDLPALKRTPTKFNGSFEFTGRYRGPPSPEIDEAWARFTEHRMIDGTGSLIAVDENDIKRSNLTLDERWFNSTVQYGEVNGDGYMATLEIFHQLHCLNILRQAIHTEYYEEWQRLPNGTYTRLQITHLDHCIEVIRQVISCYGDTGLITFHWVEGNSVPYPDFNTWHQCRDPEEILAWSQAREAPYHEKLRKDWFPNLVEMPRAP